MKLEVAFLQDVRWNNEAFDHLVIDKETKELVKAVVTTRLRAEENTDIIDGKGNGLFILLHGYEITVVSQPFPEADTKLQGPRNGKDINSGKVSI